MNEKKKFSLTKSTSAILKIKMNIAPHVYAELTRERKFSETECKSVILKFKVNRNILKQNNNLLEWIVQIQTYTYCLFSNWNYTTAKVALIIFYFQVTLLHCVSENCFLRIKMNIALVIAKLTSDFFFPKQNVKV